MERNFKVHITEKSSKAQMKSNCDPTGRYAERNLPEWFEKIAETDIPLAQKGVKIANGRNESQIKVLSRR